MNYWLVKSDPETYSWFDLVRDGKTSWEGVRNYAARIHLRAMQKGDLVLVYHSGGETAVMGTASVTRSAYPDPTADVPDWVTVDLKKGKPLANPVTLKAIKANPVLKNIPLIKISRLSVMPLTKSEYEAILSMGS